MKSPLTSVGQAIKPDIKDVGHPLHKQLNHAHGHALSRASEIKNDLAVGEVRTAPMAKRASIAITKLAQRETSNKEP